MMRRTVKRGVVVVVIGAAFEFGLQGSAGSAWSKGVTTVPAQGAPADVTYTAPFRFEEAIKKVTVSLK